MLVAAEQFLNVPVMSLQTGSELARTARAVIDPRNLTIVAYELSGALLDNETTLLRLADVREISSMGMIIDSVDELVAPTDVVRLKQVYDFQFELTNKLVIDEKKRKIGKVVGYTIEAGNFVIQQLKIRRPLLKSFGDTELLVHRSQIVKVTDEKIIIKSATVAHKVEQPTEQLLPYENPFRKVQQSSPRAE